MNKRLLFILVLMIAGFAGLIAAEVNGTDIGNSTDKDYNNKSINWTIRCAAVNHRVEGRIAMFEENRDPHSTKFVRLTDQLNQIINKSFIKGYNTTALDSDLAALNEKILKFQNDYSLFIQKLENTRNFTCGHSEGQFLAALNKSKAQLRVVRQDAEDIQNFYQVTIKKDISDLKEQRKADAEKRRVEREQNRTRLLEERENKTRAMLDKVRNFTRNEIRNITRNETRVLRPQNRTGANV